MPAPQPMPMPAHVGHQRGTSRLQGLHLPKLWQQQCGRTKARIGQANSEGPGRLWLPFIFLRHCSDCETIQLIRTKSGKTRA